MAKKKSIYVVSYQGVPDSAYKSKARLNKYLKKDFGKSVASVQRDMGQGEMSDLEVYEIPIEG